MNKSFPQFELSTSYPHQSKLPKYSSIYIKRGQGRGICINIQQYVYSSSIYIYIIYIYIILLCKRAHSNYLYWIIAMGLS